MPSNSFVSPETASALTQSLRVPTVLQAGDTMVQELPSPLSSPSAPSTLGSTPHIFHKHRLRGLFAVIVANGFLPTSHDASNGVLSGVGAGGAVVAVDEVGVGIGVEVPVF